MADEENDAKLKTVLLAYRKAAAYTERNTSASQIRQNQTNN
jgi:hypothetical protein